VEVNFNFNSLRINVTKVIKYSIDNNTIKNVTYLVSLNLSTAGAEEQGSEPISVITTETNSGGVTSYSRSRMFKSFELSSNFDLDDVGCSKCFESANSLCTKESV